MLDLPHQIQSWRSPVENFTDSREEGASCGCFRHFGSGELERSRWKEPLGKSKRLHRQQKEATNRRGKGDSSDNKKHRFLELWHGKNAEDTLCWASTGGSCLCKLANIKDFQLLARLESNPKRSQSRTGTRHCLGTQNKKNWLTMSAKNKVASFHGNRASFLQWHTPARTHYWTFVARLRE